MQKLLTGTMRLPSFNGTWEVKALGEVAYATRRSQLPGSQATDDYGFPHLNGGITPSGYATMANTPDGTIAISEGGNSCGYVQFMAEAYWCGGHCYSVIPRGVENGFLYQALKAQQPSIMALRVGSGLPNIQKSALLAFKLTIPRSLKEQSAIAAILFDMDAEISALDEELTKACQLRLGMMQELLGGRFRLI
jgi:type I restriction enzyme S subunit